MRSQGSIGATFLLTVLCPLVFACSAWSDSPALILRNLTIRGNTVFTKADIEASIQSKVGQVYDRGQLKEDLQTIIQTYQQRGYTHAALTTWFPRTFPDGVYVSLEIDEGRIGSIEIRGNARTREHIILQELLFKPNDLYNDEDRLESERLLRKKANLGNVRIYSHLSSETHRVDITVHVSDRWTLFPSASLPKVGGGELDLILALTDTNIMGSGQMGRIRYERTQEDKDTRHFFSTLFLEPRLFSSHWEFLANFTQNDIGDSWDVRLRRPFYSLGTRWAAEFQSFDRIGRAKWYQDGAVLDEFRRHLSGQAAGVTYALGQRHSQVRFSGWYAHRKDDYTALPPVQKAQFEEAEGHLLGISLQRQTTQFVRDTFVDKMGETEDIELGSSYGFSIGRSAELLGDDRDEVTSLLQGKYRQRVLSSGYFVMRAGFSASHLPNSWRDVILVGDARILLKEIYYQTLAVRLQTRLALQSEGRQQILLGEENGLRGYSSKAFDGDRLILLNLESRHVFLRHPLVVLGAALFADFAYLWRSEDGFQLSQPKRSVGVGLRVGVPKLSGAPVYRLDFALAPDSTATSGLDYAFVFSMGHMFQIGGNGE